MPCIQWGNAGTDGTFPIFQSLEIEVSHVCPQFPPSCLVRSGAFPLDRNHSTSETEVDMVELGPASVNEMVLAFVKAEVDSERFRNDYLAPMAQCGFDRHTLIDSADLESASQNRVRLYALTRAKGGLLRGLEDVTWRRVALEKADIPRLKYLNHLNWIEFSGRTRLVSDGAKNIGSIQLPDKTNAQILKLADDFEKGRRYPELIAVAVGKDLVLLEGHMRATAYALAGWPTSVDCILGESPSAQKWDSVLRG
jgi:hypothetical protein